MTSEEIERIRRIERNMEFVVEHQAKFEADITRINETLAKHNDAIVGLIQVSRTLIDHQAATDAQMSELRAETKAIAQAQRELFQAQRASDGRLDAFITFVEKYISRRNGDERPN